MSRPKPVVPPKPVLLRLDPELADRLQACAKAAGRSVNATAASLLDAAMNRKKP